MENKETTIKEFIKKVKENKKYKSLSNDIIKKEIDKYLKRYTHDLYDEKFALKKIRKELHRIYSSYQTKGKRKRDKLLIELENLINKRAPESQVLEVTNNLLSITISTKERLDNYPIIYEKIFEITGNPKTILDLGSGLNPLSFHYMNLPSLNYYTYDIDLEDIKFLNKYFKIIKINGKSAILDIRNLKDISNLPSSDIIFMFKVYDLIVPKSRKQKKFGEELINLLIKKTKFIVVSFATKTLTRKSMKLPRRIGFELMLSRNQLSFKTIKTHNEIFYIIY